MLMRDRFHFELPDVDDDFLPMYGGKVLFLGDNAERLSVAYGGKIHSLLS